MEPNVRFGRMLDRIEKLVYEFSNEDFYSEENVGKSSGKRVVRIVTTLRISPCSTKRRTIGTRNIFLVLIF